jgi:hypothetical protein
LARRGDPEAIALLRAPEFPAALGYLFDWYAEFLMWAPNDRAPSWTDWQAWVTLMQHAPSPADFRMLRRIFDAHVARDGVTRGH